jgi:CheY-like chemotaxis protein
MSLLHYDAPLLEEERPARPLVLVIDDDLAMQEMLKYALGFYGYQSVCMGNGREALTWLEQAPQKGLFPQAILLDVLMPVMNGSSFLESLPRCWSAQSPVPPVILFTADARPGRYNSLPCSKVLVKPFHIRELRECLRVVTGSMN